MKVPAVPEVPGVGRRLWNAVNSPDGRGRAEGAREPPPPLDLAQEVARALRGLPGDRYDLAISTAIIGMGRALDLRLIAEGVETAEQLQVLQSIGCHEIQGLLRSQADAGCRIRRIRARAACPGGLAVTRVRA